MHVVDFKGNGIGNTDDLFLFSKSAVLRCRVRRGSPNGDVNALGKFAETVCCRLGLAQSSTLELGGIVVVWFDATRFGTQETRVLPFRFAREASASVPCNSAASIRVHDFFVHHSQRMVGDGLAFVIWETQMSGHVC